MFGRWWITNHARGRLDGYQITWENFKKFLRRSKQVDMHQTMDIQKMCKYGDEQLHMEYWYDQGSQLLFTIDSNPVNEKKGVITITRRGAKGIEYL